MAIETARTVRVRDRAARERRATVAVAGGYAPRVGDKVVVAEGARGTQYVIGVLSALREVPRAVATHDGTTAAIVSGTGNAERLEVRDAKGALLVEYDAETQRTIVHAAPGGLEFRSERGDIEFVSDHKVTIRAKDTVGLHSNRSVQLDCEPGGSIPASHVRLDARGVGAEAAAIDARAGRASLVASDVHLAARALSAAVEHVTSVVAVLETRAGRIVERAKEAYREVEDLSQTRAGRIRMVARATLHLLGKQANLKAEHEMNIRGERIYLA